EGFPPFPARIGQEREKRARMRVAHDASRGDLLAAVQEYAGRASLALDDPRHARAGANLDAARLGFLAHGLRDGAHAADRMAPHALLSVHFAEYVVQQHIRASRRIRARIVAHDRVETEARLDRIRFEPA